MATFHVRCVHRVSGAEYMAPMKADSMDLAVERAIDEGHMVAADQSTRSISTMRSSVSDGIADFIKRAIMLLLGLYALWIIGSSLIVWLSDKLYR